MWKKYLTIILACLCLAGILLLCVHLNRGNTPSRYQHRRNTVVLLYHDFVKGDTLPKGYDPSLYCTAKKFKEDIQYLLDHHYLPLSLNDLVENKNDPGKKYFALAFDDGYMTDYTIAYPILLEMGCYGDIFINTDNENRADHEYLHYAQTKEMEASGRVTINSHFSAHNKVNTYPLEEFKNNLQQSVESIERNLGKRRHKLFAYPYGVCSKECQKIAAELTDFQFLQKIPDFKENTKSVLYRTNMSDNETMTEFLNGAYYN